MYRQNEGSFLAGAYAVLMSKSRMVGVIGGMDIPVINDFFAGYEQGAKTADPNAVVITGYVGSFTDPEKARQMALDMYQKGAEIIFQVAGPNSGMGVFKAAQESGRYAIGVDTDQAVVIEKTDPQLANLILTSMMKNINVSLYRAMKLYVQGQLPFGKTETLGLADRGTGLAKNIYYESATPADIKAKIDQLEKDIIDGKIIVKSVY
jgi:basic membrane protein A and related proteins